MAATPRTRLDLDERRAQLVAIGLELFSSRAYDEVSIDELAAAAGISKGLLYHYFPSKRDFYVATISSAAEQMRAMTEADPALPAHERLLQSVDSYLDYCEQFARGYATLMRGGIGSDEQVREIIDASRGRFAARILDHLADWPGFEDAAGPPAEAVVLAVRGWIGFVEAVSLDWLERGTPSREAVRDLIAAALGGILAAGHDASRTGDVSAA